MLAILNFGTNINDNSFIVRIVGAVLLVLVGFIVGKIVALLVRSLLHGIALDKLVKKNVSYHFSLEKQLSSVVEIVIYAVTILFTLNYLKITPYVLFTIVGIVVLLFLISFFLSLRDFLPNGFSGFRIKSKKLFVVGDTLVVRNLSCSVKRIGFLSTTVQNGDDVLQIPNMLFARENYDVVHVQPSRKKAGVHKR